MTLLHMPPKHLSTARLLEPAARTTLSVVLLFVALSFLAVVAAAQAPKIIQPGAPGEPSREITAAEASDLASIRFTEADVEFMQGMIAHHAQALVMTELLESRTRQEQMRTLARRIDLSQADEIQMMEEWLRANGQEVPDREMAAHGHSSHGGDGPHLMPGMLTPEQLAELEALDGIEFDRLFLELMIAHHQGALVMVDDLLEQPGAAQESTIFAFTADITADQAAEIDRMAEMLSGLSDDPRVELKAGFLDAEQALWNLELVAALPKPTGFFSPDAPEGIPIPSEDEEAQESSDETEDSEAENESAESDDSSAESEAAEDPEVAKKKAEAARRARMSGILNFANSDIAFADDVLFEGNFHGFNTYSIEDPDVAPVARVGRLPGGAGRRLGDRRSVDHVGRADSRAARLRPSRGR